jgi:hypothetical protein
MAYTKLSVPRSVVVLPAVPKDASSVPFALKRASAKWLSLLVAVSPAATIFPSGWTVTADATSSRVPMAVVTLPPVPNVESRVPFVL